MMYIDTILHHHIRRCPYNIISIMLISTTQLPWGWWALFWNRSLYFIRILYIAAAMKNHMVEDGWPAVDRLYSNWGYAWDCMRIDNSTITEIIVMLLFGKRCLCYFNSHYIIIFSQQCIVTYSQLLLQYTYKLCAHLSAYQWINFLIGYTINIQAMNQQ